MRRVVSWFRDGCRVYHRVEARVADQGICLPGIRQVSMDFRRGGRAGQVGGDHVVPGRPQDGNDGAPDHSAGAGQQHTHYPREWSRPYVTLPWPAERWRCGKRPIVKFHVTPVMIYNLRRAASRGCRSSTEQHLAYRMVTRAAPTGQSITLCDRVPGADMQARRRRECPRRPGPLEAGSPSRHFLCLSAGARWS